ncbi:TonB system transport protein ExbD [Mesorhizobium sp. CAU 1741]|uniref:TonB system transport protein ExbD n=1 Tax=Mesorhizobium sp. CAU 1741 TaxID=3140366 RepID=UPI00325B3730
MAGSLNSGAENDELAENHEINVTPFIDVMLVLLIIFMVAAPLATVDINVDLPASNAQAQPRPDEPLYVTVQEDLAVSVGNDEVTHIQLRDALRTATDGDTQARIFLRADKAVPYGDLMNVMNLVRMAGYTKIALVGLDAAPGAAASATPTPASEAPEANSAQP